MLGTTNIFYIEDLTCVFLPRVKKVPVATLNPTLFFFFLLHSFWVILFSFKIKNLAFVILGSESSLIHNYDLFILIMNFENTEQQFSEIVMNEICNSS